jgi:hypothetical protein
MMEGKLSSIFQLFDQQFEEAKSLFISLGKQFRSKKAVELEQRLIFLEIYLDLLSRIHFQEDKLNFRLFGPLNKIFKNLKKVKHIKMVKNQLIFMQEKFQLEFESYSKALVAEKNTIDAEVYDLILSTPFEVWENLYAEAYRYSKGLKPLMINTATTQIINDELVFFNMEHRSRLDSKALKDIYEGLRVITALENLRITSGFNSIFIEDVHDNMQQLQKSLFEWYENHLLMQHLTSFLTDKEKVAKKYLDLLGHLQIQKKNFKLKVEEQCQFLFERILD